MTWRSQRHYLWQCLSVKCRGEMVASQRPSEVCPNCGEPSYLQCFLKIESLAVWQTWDFGSQGPLNHRENKSFNKAPSGFSGWWCDFSTTSKQNTRKGPHSIYQRHCLMHPSVASNAEWHQLQCFLARHLRCLALWQTQAWNFATAEVRNYEWSSHVLTSRYHCIWLPCKEKTGSYPKHHTGNKEVSWHSRAGILQFCHLQMSFWISETLYVYLVLHSDTGCSLCNLGIYPLWQHAYKTCLWFQLSIFAYKSLA